MARLRKSICISMGLILLGVGTCLYWGFHVRGFSAREKPLAIEAFVARRVRLLATPSSAAHLKNPYSSEPEATNAAKDYFAFHCATCHGENGDGKTLINSGLYPPAPDLRGRETQRLTDGELFYIIRNGIRFTGMPAWDGDEDDTWQLVSFIRQLSDLNPKDSVSVKNTSQQASDRTNPNHDCALETGSAGQSTVASR